MIAIVNKINSIILITILYNFFINYLVKEVYMKDIIDNFLTISKIERCSYKTNHMKDFLIDFAKKYGYSVKVDKAGNILATKINPKLTLQAHYDMVCIGDVKNMQIVIENNKIYSKNSSLGADNGIAIAMMMKLMQEGADVEFLFTNNEEVGLIGAKELELQINTNRVLNLDSEDEGEVFIGCAGGVDFKITKDIMCDTCKKELFKLSVTNLPGGHSGIDIDKNIDNAILKLLEMIKKRGVHVNSFSGGEAINAIPANATAIVCNDGCKQKFVDDILEYPNGVVEFSKEYDAVMTSSNIGLLKVANSKLTLEISLRSLDNFKMLERTQFIVNYWSQKGYSVEITDLYPGWKPENNKFNSIVCSALKDIFRNCKTKVIHAGLECGILSQKFPNASFASIGPNIKHPHSKKEYVEIESIFKTFRAIKQIISL